MELASPELIRAVVQSNGNPVPAGHHHGEKGVGRPAGNRRRMRCGCGQCRECLDNARWERIFAEKFADPDYYNRGLVRSSSPFDSL